jgi:cytoskeletal protein CcmA (bactofilin family)
MIKSKFKNVHTMIGPDAVLKGSIKLEQGLIVYGQVFGDVQTRGSIRIARGAMVDGNVTGASIVLGGKVVGHLKSEGSVILKKTSELKGNISYRKLHIEDGAQFEGQCDLVLDSSGPSASNKVV